MEYTEDTISSKAEFKKFTEKLQDNVEIANNARVFNHLR